MLQEKDGISTYYLASLGEVMDTEGNFYSVDESHLLPWYVTPVGVLVYKDEVYVREKGTNLNYWEGLVIALDSEPNEMDWETAKGPNGAAAHTPTAAGYEWRLPTYEDWLKMTYIQKYGNYIYYPSDRLNGYIKKCRRHILVRLQLLVEYGVREESTLVLLLPKHGRELQHCLS